MVAWSSLVAGARASSRPSDAELAAITERGRLLAEYDAAAWHSTDAVLAMHPKEGSFNRYIAHKANIGWVVDFGRLNTTGDKFLVAYEAVQTGGPAQFTVKSFDPAREDAGWNLLAAKGVATAARDFGGTSRPYNIAVLPAERGSLYVYFYPAQIKAGVYPLGADVRYHISADGTTIREKRQMHKTIIDYGPVSSSEKAAAGYHTNVLGDVPEDTDVFLVLTRQPQMPEIVITRHYMYTISVNGKITVANRPHGQRLAGP